MKIPSKLIGNLQLFDDCSLEQMLQEIMQNWDKYNILQKHSLLDSFANRLLEDTGVNSKVDIDYFYPNNKSLFNINGYYYNPDKRIVLNKDLLDNKNGNFVYSVLCHELEHAKQFYMIEHAENFPDKERDIVKLSTCLEEGHHAVSFCTENLCEAQFFTMFSSNENVNIFHLLSIAERKAYSLQYSIYQDKENLLSLGFNLFREKYSFPLTNEEIEKIVDISYYKLYYNELPSGSYEQRNMQATVMYDLFQIVQYNYDPSYDLNILLDHHKKKETLAQYGYTIYGEIPLNNLIHDSVDYVDNISLLNNLSIEQQRVNPYLILRCLMVSQETKNYIKDEEAFIYEMKRGYESYEDEIKIELTNSYPQYFGTEQELEED